MRIINKCKELLPRLTLVDTAGVMAGVVFGSAFCEIDQTKSLFYYTVSKGGVVKEYKWFAPYVVFFSIFMGMSPESRSRFIEVAVFIYVLTIIACGIMC